MSQFIIRRLIALIPVLLGITLVAFFSIRMIPGDVALTILGQESTPELAAEIRRSLGIDAPLHAQLIDWFAHLARLDFGKSFTSGRPIFPDVVARLPATLELTFAATAIAILLAIPLGVLTATRRGGLWDYSERIFSLVGLSIPSFWLALILIYFVSLRLDLLPAMGYVPFTESPVENLRRLILPALSLGLGLMAVLTRYVRSSMLDVMGQNYILVARGKGLKESAIIVRHALKNGLIPVITILGIMIGTLIGGTVIVEEIFAWPGLGRFTLHAIHDRDYPVVQTMVMVIAFFFVAINLLVDILYSFLNPQIELD